MKKTFPNTGRSKFQDRTNAQRLRLMAVFAQSHIDCTNGIITASKAQQIGGFDQWKRFLADFGCFDEFLIDFEQKERVALICAFAGSVRRNEFGTTNKSYLRHRTVSSTVSNVCSTFRTNLWNDPSLEDAGVKSMFLKRMIRGYKLDDPETKHQKCLPIVVFKTMWANNKTVMSLAIGQLICGALFFGMSSCEYSKVEGTRKTKIIRICDLTFRFGKRVIPIRRGSLHMLKHTSSISVTF